MQTRGDSQILNPLRPRNLASLVLVWKSLRSRDTAESCQTGPRIRAVQRLVRSGLSRGGLIQHPHLSRPSIRAARNSPTEIGRLAQASGLRRSIGFEL